MDDYLSKPIKRDALGGALRRWLTPSGQGETAPADPSFVEPAPSEPITVAASLDPAAARPAPSASPAGGASGAPAPVLDLETLEQLRELMGPGFGDVLDTYLRDTPAQIAGMHQALAVGDLVALGGRAHTLKSSSDAVGAFALRASCEMLERHARSGGGVEEAARLVASIVAAFEEAGPPLGAMAGEAPPPGTHGTAPAAPSSADATPVPEEADSRRRTHF